MSITQMVAVAMRAVIQAITVANAENITRQSTKPKVGRPMMKQPILNWNTEDKYNEVRDFRLQVITIFKSYNMPDTGKIATIKSCLYRKGLQLLETLMQTAKEKCVKCRLGLIFLRKQKFNLIKDKLLPHLQDGFLRSEGKCCS